MVLIRLAWYARSGRAISCGWIWPGGYSRSAGASRRNHLCGPRLLLAALALTKGKATGMPVRRGGPLTLLVMIVIAISALTSCSGAQAESKDLSGHVLIVGSTALQPLATQAAALFTKAHPNVQVEVRGGGSVPGLASVNNHQADVGDSDIYADPALYPDPNLTDHLVCLIPFTMITNPGVTVTTLKRDDIIKIFSTGEITNWNQVGG